MNWRYKALLQLVFSNVPFGERSNYLFQRYVTRSLPTSDAKFISIVSEAREHIEVLRKYLGRQYEEATFYEFGAGQELIVPLAFYALGIERQILVDIRNLLRVELANDTIAKFQKMSAEMGFLRKPDRFLNRERTFLGSLKQYYGIDYRAPCDARATGLSRGSIDCITSTNTLEHIPPQDIKAILQECYRILRDDGVMSFRIDYQDHYAYFDSSISEYNFLKYSNEAWSFFSPSLQYQNRLRHRDFVQIFQSKGFEIVEERCKEGTKADLEIIKRLRLNTRFRQYEPEELAVRNSLITLRKRGSNSSPYSRMH